MSDKTCKTCSLWVSHGDHGECRKRAPVWISNTVSVFPSTARDCWCGEWEKREVQSEKLHYVSIRPPDGRPLFVHREISTDGGSTWHDLVSRNDTAN